MTAIAPDNGRSLTFLLFFLSLSFLCLGAHELIHHLSARSICGTWGVMTLSQFFLADGCDTDGKPWWIATLAGPLLSYALMWTGVALRSRFGLLLIFANLPLARAVTVLTRGDEMVLGRLFFGEAAWPILIALTAILLSGPLIAAWKRLPRAGRWWRYAAWLILPVLWDFFFKRVLLGPVMPETSSAAGIPVAVLVAYATALMVLVASRPRRLTPVPSFPRSSTAR